MRPRRIRALLLFALATPVATLCAAGETAHRPTAEYHVSSLGLDTGLPHPTVTATLQTRDGYLWVGTQGGLARFDGVRFMPFQPSNTPALLNGSVRCLFEDSRGALWAGMERGVVRHHRGEVERVGLDDVTVSAIAETADGAMWIGTLNHGVWRWGAKQWSQVDASGLPTNSSVRCLFTDSTGRLWIGLTAGPVYSRTPAGRIHAHTTEPHLRGFDLNAACEWPRGTLWLGGYSRGLLRIRGEDVAHLGDEDGLASLQVTSIARAAQGGVWITAGALQRVRGHDRPSLDAQTPTLDVEPTTVGEDREGNLWVATKSDGLTLIRPLPYRVISARDGLPSNAVKSVSQDREGSLWVAAHRGGIAKIAADGTVSMYSGHEIPQRDVSLVLATRDGAVWYAATALHRWKDGAVTAFGQYRPLHGLHEDRDGALWIGSGSGVFRHVDGTFTRVDLMPGRPLLYASAFADAPDGTMYIGSWNLGLFKVPPGQTTAVDISAGLPSKTVRSLMADADGRLWVGTKGAGLAILEQGRWLKSAAFAEAVGGHVFAMAEDKNGELWLGTAFGVLHVAKQELLEVARGERRIQNLRGRGLNSGFHLAPSWPGGQPNVWPTRDGKLAFATVRGVVMVDPAEVRPNTVPPPVLIERVLLDEKPVAVSDALVVPAGTKGVTIEYTGLSFVHANQVQFKYRMDGYDEDWVDAGTRRSVTYRGLKAGDHVFRVKARNNDGTWNETGASLPFRIAPFLWQTWWFRAAALAGFTVAVVATVRYVSFRRLRRKVRDLEQQAAVHRERARIARDIHDDVGNRLTEISLLTGLALRETDAAHGPGHYVRRISSSVRQVTDSLDEIVWAVSPRNDTLPSVLHYIGEFAVEFLAQAGIRCRVELPERIPARPIAAEVRHNFFLGAKEAIHNAVQHAGATEVSLRVTVTDQAVTITIRDNGSGFVAAPPEAATADGLRNMAQRMEEIGGAFALQTSPGAGTEVCFSYSWPPTTRK